MHFERKQHLLRQLHKNQEIIEEYEQHHSPLNELTAQTPSIRKVLELKHEEFYWYNDMYMHMQKIREELFQLRLDGGEFPVYRTRRVTLRLDRLKFNHAPHFLRISPQGRMFLLSPQHSLLHVYDIDELQTIRLLKSAEDDVAELNQETNSKSRKSLTDLELDNVVATGDYPVHTLHHEHVIRPVKFQWLCGKSMYVLTPLASELTETVGAHLRHYNRKKQQTLEHLHLLLKYKEMRLQLTVPLNDTEVRQQRLGLRLLIRLWSALLPRTSLDKRLRTSCCLSDDYQMTPELVQAVLKDPRWKWFGFQSITPSTDLRGMGLLGLWCLVFMAERASGIEEPRLEYRYEEQPNRQPHAPFARRLKWLREMVEQNAQHELENSKSSGLDMDSDLLGGRKYPWAAAGINVVSMLFHQMLQLPQDLVASSRSAVLAFLSFMENDVKLSGGSEGVRERRPPTPQEHVPRLAEVNASMEYLFEVTMVVIERMYKSTGAGYMDFPFVLGRVQRKLTQWITASPFDNEQHDSLVNPMKSLSVTIQSKGEKGRKTQHGRRQYDYKLERPLSLGDLWNLVEEDYPTPRK